MSASANKYTSIDLSGWVEKRVVVRGCLGRRVSWQRKWVALSASRLSYSADEKVFKYFSVCMCVCVCVCVGDVMVSVVGPVSSTSKIEVGERERKRNVIPGDKSSLEKYR